MVARYQNFEAQGECILMLGTAQGRRIRASPGPDGRFSFQGLPDGSHVLEISGWGFAWPYYKVDVQVRKDTQKANELEIKVLEKKSVINK